MKQHLPPSPLCTLRQNWKRNWSKNGQLYKNQIFQQKLKNQVTQEKMWQKYDNLCEKKIKIWHSLFEEKMWLLSVWKNVDNGKMWSLIPKMSPNPNFIPPVCLNLFICLVGALARGGIKSSKHNQGKRDCKMGELIKKRENMQDIWKAKEKRKEWNWRETGKQKSWRQRRLSMMMKETGNRKVEGIKEWGWESPKWELGFWRISILYTFQASARARNTEIVMDNSGHNGRSGGRDKHRDFSIYQFPETFWIGTLLNYLHVRFPLFF